MRSNAEVAFHDVDTLTARVLTGSNGMTWLVVGEHELLGPGMQASNPSVSMVLYGGPMELRAFVGKLVQALASAGVVEPNWGQELVLELEDRGWLESVAAAIAERDQQRLLEDLDERTSS